MIRLITYSNNRMTTSAAKCIKSFQQHGAISADIYGPGDLSNEFYRQNISILSAERGAGYWLWKPYIIYKELLQLNEGDYLIYSDAGIECIAELNNIIDQMDEDIFFFTNGWPHIEWCKMDVIKAINGSTPHELKQVQASVIFFRATEKIKDFVKEWLLYSQMPGFIDDSTSKNENYQTFAEHRHDQAILTCLQIKYGYKLHWWPTIYSEHIRVDGDNYPPLFNHHRKRNNEW